MPELKMANIHHNPVSYHLNQNEESLLQFDSYRLYAIENLLEIDNFLTSLSPYATDLTSDR
jgi:hypothetical protein